MDTTTPHDQIYDISSRYGHFLCHLLLASASRYSAVTSGAAHGWVLCMVGWCYVIIGKVRPFSKVTESAEMGTPLGETWPRQVAESSCYG